MKIKKMKKKTMLIYLSAIVIFGLIYLSYPTKSEELIGVGLAVVSLIVANTFINKKVQKEVKQYARENISVYKSLREISRGRKDNGGATTGNIAGSTSTDSEGEHGNEESTSNEGHADVQSEYLEIPELNENELPGVPESDSTDSDPLEEYSSAVPDLE